MVDIEELTKRYGKFVALDHMNLHIDKGEIFGFVGPNGAGKTTTMRIMCGLLKATSGKVTIDGVDALGRPADVKRKIGYVPDFFRCVRQSEGHGVHGFLWLHVRHEQAGSGECRR